MSDPPRAKRALIFIRGEYPAAFEKLVETGEIVQGMFLSTREQGEMVAGWPGLFLGSHLGAMPPRSRVFSGLPTQGHRGLNFRTL